MRSDRRKIFLELIDGYPVYFMYFVSVSCISLSISSFVISRNTISRHSFFFCKSAFFGTGSFLVHARFQHSYSTGYVRKPYVGRSHSAVKFEENTTYCMRFISQKNKNTHQPRREDIFKTFGFGL